MRVLSIDEMVNEAKMHITRIRYNQIEVAGIGIRCKWDGEKWHYFDREKRGTLDDFISLPQNNNTNFDIELKFEFYMDDEDGNYMDDICDVKVGMRIHYFNMERNDYEITVDSCDDYEELNKVVKEVEENDVFDWEMFSDTIKKTWNERYAGMELKDELEDNLGKQDFEKIIAEVLDKAIDTICDFCAEE